MEAKQHIESSQALKSTQDQIVINKKKFSIMYDQLISEHENQIENLQNQLEKNKTKESEILTKIKAIFADAKQSLQKLE